ncbi:DUF3667 domain-containing protein [Croceivirga thetidis]|uniref:DUF3667 domain-containing protein n=1 Tax=Croceivirga thetidis TaxID=2721623 RepID=A0ABX1GL22_9FLAO|nr:DUF3667 domain-containing protein [Croceivirga thetidis]NKI30344.1 DUF3667 domain-containing protein [Croceivirga thetidis]
MGKKKALITKGRFELKYRGEACRNCGQPLDITDKYCPNCGQVNSTKKLALRDFVDEFLSSLINYDSKLLKTLYTMMLKPGTITRDYINGKRISYTNPFRFLFSLAFIYLLLFSLGSNWAETADSWNLDKKVNNEENFNFSFNEDGFEVDTLGNRKKIKDLIPIDSIQNGSPEVAEGLSQLGSLDSIIALGVKEKQRKDSLLKANPRQYIAELKKEDNLGFGPQFEFFWTMLRRDSISTYKEAQEKFGVEESFSGEMAFNSSKSFMKAIAQPGDWLNDTIAKLPFVIFLFLPVFTVFIFVAYIRKNYTYTDHLIFSFHNQSLLFILLIISWIVDKIFGLATAGLALVLFATYLFQAMRRFYGQNVFKTIIKYLFLNTVFTILAVVALLLLSIGSIFLPFEL